MNSLPVWFNNVVGDNVDSYIAERLGEYYDQLMAKQMKCEAVNYYYESYHVEPSIVIWCGPKVVNFINSLLSAPKEHKKSGLVMYATSAQSLLEVDREEFLWKGKDGKVTKSWTEDQDSNIIGDNPEYNELWLGDLNRDMDVMCSDSLFLVIYNLMRGDWVVKQTWKSRIREKYFFIINHPKVWWRRWRDK